MFLQHRVLPVVLSGGIKGVLYIFSNHPSRSRQGVERVEYGGLKI